MDIYESLFLLNRFVVDLDDFKLSPSSSLFKGYLTRHFACGGERAAGCKWTSDAGWYRIGLKYSKIVERTYLIV